jgi:hypothetical protein
MKIAEEANLRRRERGEKVRRTFEQRAGRSGRGPARPCRDSGRLLLPAPLSTNPNLFIFDRVFGFFVYFDPPDKKK